jgi:cation transport ATPase
MRRLFDFACGLLYAACCCGLGLAVVFAVVKGLVG